jgi:hypothetical protein
MKKRKEKKIKSHLKKLLMPKQQWSVNRPVFFHRIGNRHR